MIPNPFKAQVGTRNWEDIPDSRGKRYDLDGYHVLVYKGRVTDKKLEQIAQMISDGYHTGIDRPDGINWELK